jgi:tetratricopeptide (TPR) repeat protein
MNRTEENEVRYLLRGVVAVLGGALIVVGSWSTAWSPGALAGPGRLLLEGNAEAARDAYVSVAEGLGSDKTRAEALWRGAAVTTTELDRPLEAIQMLTDLVNRHPGSTRVADAYAEMARLYRDRLDQPRRAAPLWVRAAEANPDHELAGQWWLEAGQTFDEMGLVGDATTALGKAAEYRPARSAAHLILARIALGEDAAAAERHYMEALEAADDEMTRRVARLGLATAQEHQQHYAEAMATLAMVERDDAVARRLERLEQLVGTARPPG